ncbi:MAG TPA: MFS transporter [Solirubrobacterales bacterium]|nr:MFS transporter [Solirubrobacterales bacterium]
MEASGATAGKPAAAETIRTRIPARIDRLPWSRWHWLVLIGLGTVWVLDGLEVTIVGAIGARLQEPGALGLSASQLGEAGTAYVLGACCGAIFFGYLTDRLGRKRLFLVTLLVYLLATVGTAFAGSFAWFAIFRFLTGFGIGGEYAAINSAIDELIPARVRGWVDLAVNGSFWLGAAFGAALTGVLLDTSIFSTDLGWRLGFALGALLAFGIMLVRRYVPESPRWLMVHGRQEEAERLVAEIEETVKEETGKRDLPEADLELEIHPRESTGFIDIGRTLFKKYPRRFILGFALMGTQAFLYNAVLFNFSGLLTGFFSVSDSVAGLYLIPFGIANFLGALLLGRLFDTIGRREMITLTYFLGGIGMIINGYLIANTGASAWVFIAVICATFFFASAAASAAYLTVSEVFPLETRAMAIALFYAIATGIGGAIGPLYYGRVVDGGNPDAVFLAFGITAVLMCIAAVVEWFLGVRAEQRHLEEVAEPLSAEAVEST